MPRHVDISAYGRASERSTSVTNSVFLLIEETLHDRASARSSCQDGRADSRSFVAMFAWPSVACTWQRDAFVEWRGSRERVATNAGRLQH